MLANVVQQGRQRLALCRGMFEPFDWALEKLRLSPVPMRRDHQASRDLIGNGGTPIASNQMQTKIEACRAARGSENAVLIDVEDIGIDLDERKALAKGVCITPMRRCPPSAQQP